MKHLVRRIGIATSILAAFTIGVSEIHEGRVDPFAEPGTFPTPYAFDGWPDLTRELSIRVRVCQGNGDGICAPSERRLRTVPITASVTCEQFSDGEWYPGRLMAFSSAVSAPGRPLRIPVGSCREGSLSAVSVEANVTNEPEGPSDAEKQCVSSAVERGMIAHDGTVEDYWDIEIHPCRPTAGHSAGKEYASR